jgi:hypothetical protein
MESKLNNKQLGVAWLLVMLAIVFYVHMTCNNDGIEGFYDFTGYYKKYCSSCGKRSRHNCSKCTNCGVCITPNGNAECVPGNSSGPYFREDCQYWEYGDPHDSYPYSHIFPTIQTRNTYPYRRWNIRRNRFGWRNRGLGRKLRQYRKY